MISIEQKKLAYRFKKLHIEGEMLVIPNVWNAGSAFIFEKEGYKAVATTSAGVAYSLGYPDGEDITIEDLKICVSQIAKRLQIPISVDFERGYSENVEEIKANAKDLLECGAVGFNIEDGRSDGSLDDLDYIIEKIKALVSLKKELDIDFVINARTCTYWLDVADDDAKLDIAIKRGNEFISAGADCVFIPGLMNEATIKRLVNGINGPINIILNPVYNDFKGLKKIGVRRLSVGSGPVRSVYNHIIKIANELNSEKTETIMNHDFGYARANEYFTKANSND